MQKYEYAYHMVGKVSTTGESAQERFVEGVEKWAHEGYRLVNISDAGMLFIMIFERPVGQKLSAAAQATNILSWNEEQVFGGLRDGLPPVEFFTDYSIVFSTPMGTKYQLDAEAFLIHFRTSMLAKDKVILMGLMRYIMGEMEL